MEMKDLNYVGECINKSDMYAYKNAWANVKRYIKSKRNKDITAVILNKNVQTHGWEADIHYSNGDIDYKSKINVPLVKSEEEAINILRIARGNEKYTIAVSR